MDDRQQLLTAIRGRDVIAMENAARRLPHVALDGALAMVVVLAELGDRRYPRWAERWAQRVARERRLVPEAVEQVRNLLRELPRQGEAGAVTIALRSYAAPPRTWS